MCDMLDLKPIEPMGQLAPEAMAGFTALGQAALAEGAIPKKYKESMAIAVALTTQVPLLHPGSPRSSSACSGRDQRRAGRDRLRRHCVASWSSPQPWDPLCPLAGPTSGI